MGELRNFRGGEKFWGERVENFFFGGGLRNFRGVNIISGGVKFFR